MLKSVVWVFLTSETASHFQMNVVLMESKKLTSTEVNLLFFVIAYVQKGRGRIGFPPEATVCLMCHVEKDFQRSLQNELMILLLVQIGS